MDPAADRYRQRQRDRRDVSLTRSVGRSSSALRNALVGVVFEGDRRQIPGRDDRTGTGQSRADRYPLWLMTPRLAYRSARFVRARVTARRSGPIGG